MKKILKNIFSLIVLVVACVTTYQVLKLNMLPDIYLTLFIIGEVVLFIFGLLLYNLKHKFFIVLGILLYLISIAGNIFGYYYISQMNRYIDHNFSVDTYKVLTHYYVVKNVSDPVASMDELTQDTPIQYYKYSRSIEIALAKLGNYSYKAIDNEFNALSYLVDGSEKYFLVPSGTYDYLIESSNKLSNEQFAILYEFDIEEEFVKNQEVKDSYNIYLNGLDYTGVNRDFNMIITVNTKTHKILLTSIPRDYYIDVPAYKMKDTLLYMGALDPKISQDALENLFDINIDYNVSVNTSSLVTIVDTLGGVEFCSNSDFYTFHDTTLGSYADKGQKVHVTKGCNTYNGLEILAIARERVRIPGGDRGRQENCRKILISIGKKLASITTLTNYTEILNSFDGLYTTDMNKEIITNLAKEGLEDMNFEILEQSVDGVDGMGIGGMGTGKAWIVEPNMNTVNSAKEKMKEVMNET